jgi:hypothetical protein
MRIRIVVDDEMNGLDVAISGLREVGLDHDGNNPTVFRDHRHVQADVPTTDGTPTRYPLENPSYLLVGCFRVFQTERRCKELIYDGAGDNHPGCGGSAGLEE